MLHLGLRRSRGRIPPLCFAGLAVIFPLLTSRSYAYGSGFTFLYLEGRGPALALAVTAVSLWVQDGGVGFQGLVGYDISALGSTRRYCIITYWVGLPLFSLPFESCPTPAAHHSEEGRGMLCGRAR